MTYAEIAKERDGLKSEIETLRAIMDKMLEKGKALEAENAELKARLEKAVELPCKVGDTLYFVNEYRPTAVIEKYCVSSIAIFPDNVVRCYIGNYNSFILPNKNVVFSQEAAETRLKELQGGHGNVDNGG